MDTLWTSVSFKSSSLLLCIYLVFVPGAEFAARRGHNLSFVVAPSDVTSDSP